MGLCGNGIALIKCILTPERPAKGAMQATRPFNGQLEEQHIDIVPREVPEYPLAGRLENILPSIIQETFPENQDAGEPCNRYC